jgi:hypothetical protein
MSGSVARNMSGLGNVNGNTPKPGTLVTGDPEDEIRRSIYRLATRAAIASGSSTRINGVRLDQINGVRLD